MSIKSDKDISILKCENCGITKEEAEEYGLELSVRQRIDNHIYCSECVMELGYGYCDVCGEAISYDGSWELFWINKENYERSKKSGVQFMPQRTIVCPRCYYSYRKDKNKVFTEDTIFYDNGDVSVKLNDIIVNNVSEKFQDTPTYLVSFLALRGVLELKLKGVLGEDAEKYCLARKSLTGLGFNDKDEIALEQLNQLFSRLNQ